MLAQNHFVFDRSVPKGDLNALLIDVSTRVQPPDKRHLGFGAHVVPVGLDRSDEILVEVLLTTFDLFCFFLDGLRCDAPLVIHHPCRLLERVFLPTVDQSLENYQNGLYLLLRHLDVLQQPLFVLFVLLEVNLTLYHLFQWVLVKVAGFFLHHDLHGRPGETTALVSQLYRFSIHGHSYVALQCLRSVGDHRALGLHYG